MIAKYNRLSLMVGAPGIVLQIGGWIGVVVFADKSRDSIAPMQVVALVALIGGTVMLWYGLGYYAKSKGRPALLGLVGILGLLGLLILALLEDRARDAEIPQEGLAREDNFIARMSIYLGLFGIVPVLGTALTLLGLVLGIVGLRRSEERGGKVPAVVGICLNGFFLVVSVVLVVVMVLAPDSSKPMKRPVRKTGVVAPTGG